MELIYLAFWWYMQIFGYVWNLVTTESFTLIELDLNKHELKSQDHLVSHMNIKNALESCRRLKNPSGAARSHACLMQASVSISTCGCSCPWCPARVEMSAANIAGGWRRPSTASIPPMIGWVFRSDQDHRLICWIANEVLEWLQLTN
jgi:hypothetical protein